MFQRDMNEEDVEHIIKTGEIIGSYPDDKLFGI